MPKTEPSQEVNQPSHSRRSVLGSSAVFGALGAGLLLPTEGKAAMGGRRLDLDSGPDSAYA